MDLFRKSILFGAAFGTLLISSALAQAPATLAAQITLCKQGIGESSIAACDAVIKSETIKDEELSAIYYGRGMAHDSLKQYALAINDYEKATDLKGDNIEAAYNRGVACNFLNRTAPPGSKEADASGADGAKAYGNCGLAFSIKDMNTLALSHLDQAIKMMPQNGLYFLHRANVLLYEDQYERALPDFTRSVELRPTPSGHINRGVVYKHLEQYALALADFDAGVTLQPNAVPGLSNSCMTRAILNQELEKAIWDCNQALRLRPSNSYAFEARGLVFFRKGDYKAAINDMTSALSFDPKSATALYVRGVAKIKIGDTHDGQIDITKANKSDSKEVAPLSSHGVYP